MILWRAPKLHTRFPQPRSEGPWPDTGATAEHPAKPAHVRTQRHRQRQDLRGGGCCYSPYCPQYTYVCIHGYIYIQISSLNIYTNICMYIYICRQSKSPEIPKQQARPKSPQAANRDVPQFLSRGPRGGRCERWLFMEPNTSGLRSQKPY